MAPNIKHAEAERLARELSAATGKTLTEAVVDALRQRLSRQRTGTSHPQTAKELLQQARQRLSQIPIRDPRPTEDILGYDDRGLPR